MVFVRAPDVSKSVIPEPCMLGYGMKLCFLGPFLCVFGSLIMCFFVRV